AMATRFAASGADVALLARRPDVLAEAKAAVEATAKGSVAAFPCDVAKATDVARAHANVLAALDRKSVVEGKREGGHGARHAEAGIRDDLVTGVQTCALPIFAMATRFAASGADVALLARRPDVLAEAKAAVEATAKGSVAAFPCDVAKATDVARAHANVLAA